jgi:hypothetical protein
MICPGAGVVPAASATWRCDSPNPWTGSRTSSASSIAANGGFDFRATPSTASARSHAQHSTRAVSRPSRGDAPIAVNQNQTLPALQNFDRWIGHRNARHNLATPLDRARNPLDRSRFRHTRTGKAQIQAVQIESQHCVFMHQS